MKKVIHFSKGFVPAVIFSSVLIIVSIFGLVTKGFNLGLDFESGLIEQVCIAKPAASFVYNGSANVTVTFEKSRMYFVLAGADVETETKNFYFKDYPTVADLKVALKEVPNLVATFTASDDTPSSDLFVDSESLPKLGANPYKIFYIPSDAELITTDQVRDVLAGLNGVSVQNLGTEANRTYQIRVIARESNLSGSNELKTNVRSVLDKAYGAENIAILKADFAGAQYSENLVSQVIWLLCGTFLLIWGYATLRFRWDFALGAVLALIHDILIMTGFIVWTRMEFSSTTIAAYLTIIGYSINDTIVIFDRIRELTPLMQNKPFTEVLNTSLTHTLSRTILTTVTTLLAVFSLYFFTTGTMKNFALALIVGMISGTYSSVFIASAFISLTNKHIKTKVKTVKTDTIAV